MAIKPRIRGTAYARLTVVGCMLLSATLAARAEKFKLIAQQYPEFAEATTVHHAAQLALYDGAAAVTIAMPAALPVAEPKPAAPPPDRNAARVMSLAPALSAAARENELDPLLLHAIAHVESRHNANAQSPAGARGVMQMMPATARRFGVSDPEHALFDSDTNVRAGAAYLRTLRTRYRGDLQLMLAAYNAGEGAVAKHGGQVPPYPETQAYVRDVLAVYRRLTNSFSVSAAGTLVARGSQP